MNLSGETEFEHCRGDDYACVTCAEQSSVTMIKKLIEKYPDEVTNIHYNDDGSICCHVPASWMRLRPPTKRTLTEEQRAKLVERMASVNAKRIEHDN